MSFGLGAGLPYVGRAAYLQGYLTQGSFVAVFLQRYSTVAGTSVSEARCLATQVERCELDCRIATPLAGALSRHLPPSCRAQQLGFKLARQSLRQPIRGQNAGIWCRLERIVCFAFSSMPPLSYFRQELTAVKGSRTCKTKQWQTFVALVRSGSGFRHNNPPIRYNPRRRWGRDGMVEGWRGCETGGGARGGRRGEEGRWQNSE